jgi:hypothetical protein
MKLSRESLTRSTTLVFSAGMSIRADPIDNTQAARGESRQTTLSGPRPEE